MKRDDVILVRGGGDLATGTIHRLWSAGLKVLVLEAEHPAAIRRQVSVSEAVYEGGAVVEGMRAALVKTLDEAIAVQKFSLGAKESDIILPDTLDVEAVVIWHRGDVPVMVDPKGELIPQVQPAALVDAILAKKNLGTTRDMAPLTIALGPGFTAGVDVDFVVETKRGHRLGRIIREGAAIPNTGVPGVIGGYGAERVIHAEKAGIFRNVCAIGDIVSVGETIAEIETPDGIRTPVTTRIAGILRGLLRDGYPVTPGFKVADVDPRREELENCFLISDKARCIAGSVLELIAANLWK